MFVKLSVYMICLCDLSIWSMCCMWSVYMICLCDLYDLLCYLPIWSAYVICPCDLSMWSVHVICLCDLSMWSAYMICLCDLSMWSVHVICLCDLSIWSVYVIYVICLYELFSRTWRLEETRSKRIFFYFSAASGTSLEDSRRICDSR
jgi:hypothetical protein